MKLFDKIENEVLYTDDYKIIAGILLLRKLIGIISLPEFSLVIEIYSTLLYHTIYIVYSSDFYAPNY